MDYHSIVFRELTHESLERIERYRQEEAERIVSERLIHDDDNVNKSSKDEQTGHKRMPNKELADGEKLPRVLQNKFPAKLIGKPIEEIDYYYRSEYIFVVINRDKTIFRFSATRACFIFTPFNCFRRLAIRILTHPIFNMLVMLTILTNCIFMTLKNVPEMTEYIFVILYTLEALIKCIARGFILEKYTYLRDPWNWLDFIVITFAYITFFVNLGKFAVLRTFRVLRALKTIAVIPGLKTIVNALIQSFISLKDVAILSIFILSLFALVGLQLYMGVLRQKCVPTYKSFLNNSNIGFNMSYNSYLQEIDNESYWYQENELYVLCGNASGSTKCPNSYVCWKDRGMNPDFGYTNFDNYGWAMLACFRLMAQDYWENLYLLVLSAAGRYHFFYFVAVIFFGSFYLVNLTLAIVAMSYLEQKNKVEAENKERERRKSIHKLELKLEKARRLSEVHAHLHVDNTDRNRTVTFSGVPIEYEKNEKKNELNNIQLSQSSSSIFQPRKSSLILPNVTTIPLLDETQQNSANEDGKIQQTSSFSYLSDGNQNDNDATITLYQTKPHIRRVPISEPLPAQESNRASVQSIDMDTTNTCGQSFVKLLRIYCCEWNCELPMFQKFQAVVSLFILDPFVDLFIIICILLNTLFMAIDQPGQSEQMTRILTLGNYIFISIFTAECILKIITMTPAKYFKIGWNVFDLIIVTVSLIELLLANVKGLSVLRTFRLLRVFKLAKSWKTLNRLISIIWKSIGALGNLTLILSIIIFIFAVMGMQLFGQKYAQKFGKDIPRWNFFDFFHSFMIVFRVLCGEWIESMWVCLECAGWPCIPFFLLTFLVGNLVILNLFLALLLGSFSSNVLEKEDDDENKIRVAIDRIQRFFHFLINFIFCRKKKTNINDTQESVSNLPLPTLEESNANDLSTTNEDIEMHPMNNNSIKSPPTWQILHMPPDCCPTMISKHFSCCSKCIPKCIQKRWTYLRSLAHCFVEHRFFEWFIIVIILVSSITLALEDIHTRQQPTWSKVLSIFDKIFTIIFTIELIIKWLAYGIKTYFKNGWNILDFFIVVVSILGTLLVLFGVADIPAFKSMRTLRALRPLRVLSRFEETRVVVNALFGAIPSIFNVLLVILVFWLIFSIMSVQLFGGKFYKCVYVGTHNRVDISENITNKIDCLKKNFTWENSRINFDNVLSGYLALYQVATFKGWIEIMADATDAKELGIGAMEMFMTEEQKKYYNAMKKMANKKPTKALPRPKFALSRFFFDLTTNQKFDIFIMICIFLNMVCMCLEHYHQSHTYDLVLEYINKFFVAILVIECIMKLIALHFKYFTIPWNIFDFLILIVSILEQILGEIMSKFFVNPTLLRVARVARIGRILRLVKGTKGIRTLIFALAVSMPALFNIALLLFLIMFIYSIFGMSFFAYVRKSAGVTDLFNFETFPNSMIILFQMCTTAGWSGVYQGLTNEQPSDCDPTISSPSHKGDCGDTTIATPFLVSYVIITSLVVINMFIAIILENFSQAQEDVQQGLTTYDYDMYYEKWQSLDPSDSQFIRYDQLSDFVDDLERPLRVPKPNQLILVVMDLPIYEDDRMHCVDILDGLIKYFFGTLDAPIDMKKDRPKDYHPITTTIKRQRELYLGRIVLKAFRINVERRRNERKNEELILKKATTNELIQSDDLETPKLVSNDNQNHEMNLTISTS